MLVRRVGESRTRSLDSATAAGPSRFGSLRASSSRCTRRPVPTVVFFHDIRQTLDCVRQIRIRDCPGNALLSIRARPAVHGFRGNQRVDDRLFSCVDGRLEEGVPCWTSIHNSITWCDSRCESYSDAAPDPHCVPNAPSPALDPVRVVSSLRNRTGMSNASPVPTTATGRTS